jgi:SNF2 family DNA or RNA helicase
MIPLYFNEKTLEVSILSSSLTKSEIEMFLSHLWIKDGKKLINHWLGFPIFQQHYPKCEFNIPESLSKKLEEFSKTIEKIEYLKSITPECQHTDHLIEKIPTFQKIIDAVELNKEYTLKPNQKLNIIMFYLCKNGILADQMGMGKTLSVFGLFMAVKNLTKYKKMIYITRVDLIDNVFHDISKMVPTLNLFRYNGYMSKKKKKEFESLDWDVLIINLEKFRTMGQELYNIFSELCNQESLAVVAVDECTSLKTSWDGSMSNMTESFMKCIKSFYNKIPYRIAMSGTPIENSISDICNLYYFADRELLGVNYDWFVQNFCKFGYRKVFRYGRMISMINGIKGAKNVNIVKLLIRHKFFQRKHTEVPDFKENLIPIYLTNKEIKSYNLIIDEHDDEEENISLYYKLISFLNSCDSKIKMLKYVLDQSTDKDLVFCKYIEHCQETLVRILTQSNYSFFYVNGQNKNQYKDKVDIEKRFKQKERILLSTDALKFGFNFQFARRVIHYELPFKMTDFEQRNGRIQRLGQEHLDIEWVILYVHGSIEEDILKKMRSKGKISDSMTTELYNQSQDSINVKNLQFKKIKVIK